MLFERRTLLRFPFFVWSWYLLIHIHPIQYVHCFAHTCNLFIPPMSFLFFPIAQFTPPVLVSGLSVIVSGPSHSHTYIITYAPLLHTHVFCLLGFSFLLESSLTLHVNFVIPLDGQWVFFLAFRVVFSFFQTNRITMRT
jgi:hypothetical protein